MQVIKASVLPVYQKHYRCRKRRYVQEGMLKVKLNGKINISRYK